MINKHVNQSVHSDTRSDTVHSVSLSKPMTMVKTQDLSNDMRQNVIKRHKDGKRYEMEQSDTT